MREEILQLVISILSYDDIERAHIADTIAWIESGAGLFRIQKPDVPPKHLVSYFVMIDPVEKKILLVDHVKAEKWLPTGGHVEKDEHPKTTVEREIEEELFMKADFLDTNPLFLTNTVTVGKTAGHTDVSLWYVVRGDATRELTYGPNEFNGYKWFGYEELLNTDIETLDPHMHRFVQKFLRSGT